ncbi:thaumatin family-domain-containing protein [Chaetomium tenue]|uniref:Thaumatin family-domain-containing protein n=1 Tax=Chaetomium tenue TaxID=1854479 RepID=A0ACB7P503_9PEZI|nr:thaumatin family-domain-containing protein [Chaetomium globosum]
MPEHPISMPRPTWLKELHGNPKSACRDKNKTRRNQDKVAGNVVGTSVKSTTPADSTNITTAGSLSDRTPIQLTVVNSCGEPIWPGIVTQNGIGPETGGYKLTPGSSKMIDGSGPSTFNGVNGHGAACLTGDCLGKLNCQFAGQVPTTLAEFTLQGGDFNDQTFYDISLVDGYNLPLAIIYHPAPNTTWIPPNLTNCACIATAGYLSPSSSTSLHPSPDLSALNTNTTYPMPYESVETNSTIQSWCPSQLQQYPPHNKPGSGPGQGADGPDTLPNPADGAGNSSSWAPRPSFQPCLSPCSATHEAADCCTGPYNDPGVCVPSTYARRAKRVCPDAYSFAYDDRASTFVVPAGGGWEVRFCPRGRSTDILGAFGEQVRSVGAGAGLDAEGWGRVRDWGYVEKRWRGGGGLTRGKVSLGVVVVGLVVAARVLTGDGISYA